MSPHFGLISIHYLQWRIQAKERSILHIGCCLSLAADFFFSESNIEMTSGTGDPCNGSIVGFDDELELLLMF